MKLSDAFLEKQEDPVCEIKVQWTNIRGKEGENLPVVQKCDILKQYCEFMDIVFKYQAELKEQPTSEDMQGCYEKALQEAISKNILTDYLTRKGTEVINMFFGEYDYDLDMQVKAEEAREEGLAEGRAEGLSEGRTEGQQQKALENARTMIADKLPLDKVALYSGLSLEEVKTLAAGS